MHRKHSLRDFPREMIALWQLAWPILVGQLAIVGMGVADVAMSGHFSANALAAVSLGTSVWSIIIVTLMGVMMSVNPSVAHHAGAEEHHLIASLVRQSLWKGLLVGSVAFALANLTATVFDSMNIDIEVRRNAKLFLHIISLGTPAFAAYRVFYGYSASLGHTRPMMIISLAALIWNIAVNYVLIFGHLGFPALGGLGCAVATSSGTWLMLAAMAWYIHHAPPYQSTNPFGKFEKPDWRTQKTLLHIGLPIGITYFAESSAFCIIALLVADFGAREVAAHQIALNFSSLVFMVPLSLGIGLITRVGTALGEGDPLESRYRSWSGVTLALTWAVISATGIAVFALPIASFYTDDPAVAERAAELLLLAAIFQLSDATQASTSCAIRGYKVTRPPMVIHMTAFWGFCIPLGYILGRAPQWFPFSPPVPMAARGFWIALVVGLTIAALLLTGLLRHTCNSAVENMHAANK